MNFFKQTKSIEKSSWEEPSTELSPKLSSLPRESTFKGICMGLASAICFGLMSLIVRIAQQFPTSQLMFARGVIGVLLLSPFVFRDIPKLIHSNSAVLWLRFGAGAVASFSMFYNIQTSGVGPATALSNLATVFVILLSVLILKERFVKQQWLGMVLVIAGAALLQSPVGFNVPIRGIIIGVSGAFASGIAMISLKKASKRFSANLVVWGFCFVILLVASSVPGPQWSFPYDSNILILGLSGLLGVVGQLFLTQSYLHLPAALASTLTLSVLVWSVAFEALYLQTLPEKVACFCYALILLGLHLSHSAQMKTKS